MQIEQSKILLVEGTDEVGFFEALCKKINIRDIQIIETGGKDKFKLDFPNILNARGFEQVTSMAIVRDADESADSAISSVNYQLNKHHLPLPDGHGRFASHAGSPQAFSLCPATEQQECLKI